MDDCRTDAYRLSSASSTVSMTVLVVFSMLSLPCGVDDLRSCRRRVALNSLRSLKAHFPPQNVRTSFWKESSLGAFVRSAVCRDFVHNLPD